MILLTPKRCMTEDQSRNENSGSKVEHFTLGKYFPNFSLNKNMKKAVQ